MSRRIKVENYEIKSSKLGVKIPVINGVHLHSIYNPIKEAASLINKFESTIKSKKNILVLGLGFGYHIIELMNNLREYWGDDFKVYVIEPCREIIQDCLKEIEFPKNNIKIFCSENIEKLYSNSELVNFLLNKPGVISHPASFNLHKEFFKDFLQHSSSTQMREILNGISNPLIKEAITKRYNENMTLKEVMEANKGINSYSDKIDIFLEAFRLMYDGESNGKILKRGKHV